MSCLHYFSDKKSERAKDLHLVKKLAALLRAKSPKLGRCLSLGRGTARAGTASEARGAHLGAVWCGGRLL